MGYRYPKHRLRDTEVIDVERLNENFQAITEEASSQLNEHNWSASAFGDTERTSLFADAAAYKLHRATGNHAAVETPYEPSSWPNVDGNMTESREWALVPDMTQTISSEGGLVYVIGSCSLYNDTTSSSKRPTRGAHFAIRIDGQVIPESIVGGTEFMQEDLNRSHYAERHAFGMRRTGWPVCVELVYPIARGRHTIEMVMMGDATSQRDKICIFCRELDVIEMLTGGRL